MRSSRRWRHTPYVPVGALGALRLQHESSPLASSTVAYAYDVLGPRSARTVAASLRRAGLGRARVLEYPLNPAASSA